MTFIDECKKKYTEFELADATTKARIQAKINEMSLALTLNGVTPSLTGFPTGTVVANAVTAAGNSTSFDFGNNGIGGENVREPVLVRIAATAGTTPTATYAIQGSTNNSTWNPLLFSDSATPTTFSSSTFTLTGTGTVVKVVKRGQMYRYLRVTLSAVTNMTSTIDVYPLGD